MRRGLSFLALGAALSACEPAAVPPPQPPPQPTATATAARPTPSAAADPLGDKPALPKPKAFEPPAPVVFSVANGMQVWLIERHTLPMVSVTVTVPSGSAQDPADRPGLAHITADMLDEGAGKRSAVELSSAVNDLGASLATGNGADGSFAALTVLKKNWAPAFAILADVVARPRLDPKEWKRVSGLWENRLKKRADDPAAVSRVVSGAALYGPGTPYGHPSDGLLAGAKKVDLGAVAAFYKAHWRPERAVMVVTGDVTADEVKQAIAAGLDGWKPEPLSPKAAIKPLTAAETAELGMAIAGGGRRPPRLVLVDRTEAPQAVVAVVRAGVKATDPSAPLLDLVNTALGGSFTSRLNQNLREDHGWTYGARSGFTETRGLGSFVARAAVQTEVTGPALREMLAELRKMTASGLTPEELGKVQAQDRADLVQTYETVNGVTQRLGTLSMLGLPPNQDVVASRARQRATLPELAKLAQVHVDPASATVVIVGPRAAVEPQLADLGLGEPEIWDAEGNPAPKTATPARPAATPAKAPAKK